MFRFPYGRFLFVLARVIFLLGLNLPLPFGLSSESGWLAPLSPCFVFLARGISSSVSSCIRLRGILFMNGLKPDVGFGFSVWIDLGDV